VGERPTKYVGDSEENEISTRSGSTISVKLPFSLALITAYADKSHHSLLSALVVTTIWLPGRSAGVLIAVKTGSKPPPLTGHPEYLVPPLLFPRNITGNYTLKSIISQPRQQT
jgi:hypothetical protein